ncbi:MAG: UDP-N-acetylmuramate:L-alanyl-gamma-D-glutamyl-meso-diaminopimelate ligase [Gammaproteobacteria bacterium]|nr:MAG: UDP-N-acetylmuramate:L-alanyl-gamma-D-glutamyl-meso-diaminopimelate ligase [Gammaproteobacteria bacterium]
MHIHFLGICGTFVGSLALVARELGHEVTGSDAGVYPPMSTLLASQGIAIHEGYDPAQLSPRPDLVIIGNAMSRGNPAVEAVLEQGIPYTSASQWLCEAVLQHRHVLAVAGTHGKTTTTTLLTWILECAGLQPGFLIGGVPKDFPVSARLGQGPYFVIEADEYDTAFFDKRSKFVHYRPRTLVLNNLEYDHADIFPDLAAIQRQFQHLLRTVPAGGRILCHSPEPALEEVIAAGCWTPVERYALQMEDGNAGWQARLLSEDGSRFEVLRHEAGQLVESVAVSWALLGQHNVANALAAIAAAYHVGVPVRDAAAALARCGGVARRLELRAEVNGVAIFDDFAHHPTAIRTTLQGLRAARKEGRLFAVLEPRSNTMKRGVHRDELAAATQLADRAFWFRAPEISWDLAAAVGHGNGHAEVIDTVDAIVAMVKKEARPGDAVVVMSNGGFQGIHDKLIQALGNHDG